MPSTNNNNDDIGDEEEVVDITDLVRLCASRCLSHSRPFTPLAKNDRVAASLPLPLPLLPVGGNDAKKKKKKKEDEGTGGDVAVTSTLLEGLRVIEEENDDHANDATMTTTTTPLDLQDVMTALELGDERMDCCEIPLEDDRENDDDDGSGRRCRSDDPLTFPPRIAPKNLTDGTTRRCAPAPPPNNDASGNSPSPSPENNYNPPDDDDDGTLPLPLLLPRSPCPSLLPHWDRLRLSGVFPLLMLQLTALEAYVGTDNGGSNAAETLYCVTWFHDGVLKDMAERLGVYDDTRRRSAAGIIIIDDDDDDDEELSAARWALFASSLGAVRIAESVRCAVVNADFYEEEDFGVTLHGERANGVSKNCNDDEGGGSRKGGGCGGGPSSSSSSSSSMRFCPALRGSRYVADVWDAALSRLHRCRASSRKAKGDDDGKKKEGNDANEKKKRAASASSSAIIEAVETVLRYQQSFFQAVELLSNLNDETVRDFAKIAARRSRECVCLLEKLLGGENSAAADVLRDGLVGPDGRLLRAKTTTTRENDNRPLLSASFDPFVNRRLLGNAPVRRARFRRPSDAVASLLRLAAELEWGVCDPILRGRTLGGITRMLERNSLRGCGGAVPVAAAAVGSKLEREPEEGGGPGTTTTTTTTTEGAPVGMNVLPRSLLVLNLYFDDKLFGQHDFGDMIGQHMRQQCAVPELLIRDGAWTTRLAKPLYDTLKGLCLNRHRERGFTDSVLLPAFRVLQYEAATVDERFREEHGLDPATTPSYATNYVILNTIRLMERHVGLGIELALYPNWYDLSTALWYRDFLLSALINVRGSIERERAQRREMDLRIKMEQKQQADKKAKAQLHQQSKKKGKTKKGKKASMKQSTPLPPTTTAAPLTEDVSKPKAEDFEDQLDYTSLLLHRNLCRGLVRYIAVLRQAKLLRDPPASITAFTTHRRRFEKRFEAFGAICQPPSLSYDDYLRGSDFTTVKNEDLLSSAADCFRSGKGVVDWLLNVIDEKDRDDRAAIDGDEEGAQEDAYISARREEIMAMAKVCVTNSLFLHKLASVTASGKTLGSASISLEFKAHKQYCTMSIT